MFGVGTAALGWYWQRDQLAVPVVGVSVYAELCVCVFVCRCVGGLCVVCCFSILYFY